MYTIRPLSLAQLIFTASIIITLGTPLLSSMPQPSDPQNRAYLKDMTYNSRLKLDMTLKDAHGQLAAATEKFVKDPKGDQLENFVRQWIISLIARPAESGQLSTSSQTGQLSAIDIAEVAKHITPKTLNILTFLDQLLPDRCKIDILMNQKPNASWRSINASASLTQVEQKTIASLAHAIQDKYIGRPAFTRVKDALYLNDPRYPRALTTLPVWWSQQCADIAFYGQTLSVSRLWYSGTKEEQEFMKFLTYLACRAYFYVHGDKQACKAVLGLTGKETTEPCGLGASTVDGQSYGNSAFSMQPFQQYN